MQTEYEATFENIDVESVHKKLKSLEAEMLFPRTLFKRVAFAPLENSDRAWLRVRQERDKTTLSLKEITGDGIESQKETELTIDSFEEGVTLLERIGCKKKAYQENYREAWQLDNVVITIDEWPFLEPFLEIEGADEKSVMRVSDKLGFNWSDAIFDAVTYLYAKKYSIERDVINNKTPKIVFEMENPFISKI